MSKIAIVKMVTKEVTLLMDTITELGIVIPTPIKSIINEPETPISTEVYGEIISLVIKENEYIIEYNDEILNNSTT